MFDVLATLFIHFNVMFSVLKHFYFNFDVYSAMLCKYILLNNFKNVYIVIINSFIQYYIYGNVVVIFSKTLTLKGSPNVGPLKVKFLINLYAEQK